MGKGHGIEPPVVEPSSAAVVFIAPAGAGKIILRIRGEDLEFFDSLHGELPELYHTAGFFLLSLRPACVGFKRYDILEL